MKRRVQEFLKQHSYLLTAGTVLLTLVVVFFTLFPSDLIGGSRLGRFDKVGHMVLFGSWTYLYGLYRYFRYPDRPSLFTIFLVGIFFGTVIELMQFVLPFDRSPELFDIAFDALGAFLAVLVLHFTVEVD